MSRRSGFIGTLIVLLCLILISCSGGNSPLSPGIVGNQNLTSGNAQAASGASNICWGIWDVTIDPATQTVGIIPLRQVAFNANVTIFLQPPVAPINLLKLVLNPTSDFANGYVDCTVTLEHPFKALPMYRGFDVRGIFMADGSFPVESVPGLTRSSIDEARLLNADGYTRWWNSLEFGPEGELLGFQYGSMGIHFKPNATLNPYKYFADDLDEFSGVETMDTANRGTFAVFPGINSRNYLIQFPLVGGIPEFRFQYAVDAAWDPPDEGFAPDYPIDSFNENAQVREPYHLTLTDIGSTAYYVGPGESGGEIRIAVEVLDWQTPESGVSTELSALYLESDLFGGPVDLLPIGFEQPGSKDTGRIYSAVIDDLTLSHSGDYEVLVAAVSSVGTHEPNLPTGGMGWTYPDEPLVAFRLSTLFVDPSPDNFPPVAVADQTDPLTGFTPLIVHFDPTGSYDPDEPTGDFIELYEWDIDNDGTFDYSNTDGSVVDHQYPDAGTYYAQLRVTDTFGASDMLALPLEIVVEEGTDDWPMGFHDLNNTCYNPNSHVTPPLTLVYDVQVTGNNHSQLTIGNGKIYMVDSGGYLRVLDQSDGSELWSKDIHSLGSFWTGASAALWEDSVITGGTGIWSFDSEIGTDNWHMYPSTSFDHQGQVIVDGTIYFKASASELVSVEVSDGSQNWTSPWSTFPLFPPVYGESGGQAYIAAPRYSSLRCVNADTGAMVWEQPTGGDVFHNPVVVGDYVYYGGTNGILYKTHLATGTNAATADLGGYQPMGIWLSDTDMFMVTRLGASTYNLASYDFDLNLNWVWPIEYTCEHGVYSDGYVWLAVRLDGTNMQMVAYDADDGTQAYAHPTTFNYCWGGISSVGDRLYIADNYSRLLCFETE